MKTHSIPWNTVTRYSQALAIILFVGVFVLGFLLGKEYELRAIRNGFAQYPGAPAALPHAPVTVDYLCNGTPLTAVYLGKEVRLTLPGKREITLIQKEPKEPNLFSSSDDSVTFEKSDTKAKLVEQGSVTLSNCIVKPSLQ